MRVHILKPDAPFRVVLTLQRKCPGCVADGYRDPYVHSGARPWRYRLLTKIARALFGRGGVTAEL